MCPKFFLKIFPYYIYKLYIFPVIFYKKFDFCERLGQGLFTTFNIYKGLFTFTRDYK